MSNRVSFALAVLILLAGAFLRMWELNTVPPGLNEQELIEVRIAETAREGSIEVFYNLGGEGREGFYHVTLAFTTTMIGNGTLGFRLFSVWIGMLTLAMAYTVGRRLYGYTGGLVTMALLAFALWPVLLSRTVARETLIPLFVLTIIAGLAVTLPVYRRRRQRGDQTTAAALLGVLLGVSMYVHPAGLLIVLFAMLFIAFMLISRRAMSRRRLSYVNFALLLMLIIGMPYVISTLRLPELGGIDRLTGDDPVLSLTTMLRALGGIAVTGDSNPLHNLPGRPLFGPITTALILAGVALAAWSWRRPRHAMILIALAVFSPVFLLASHAPNFLNFSLALPIMALLAGLAASAAIEVLPRYGRLLALVVLAAIMLYNFDWTQRDLLQSWPQAPEVRTTHNARLGLIADYIDRYGQDAPLVACGWSPDQSPTARQLTDAQLIGLMMNHKDAPVRFVDCYNALVMPNGGEGQRVILPELDVIENAHPAVRQWLDDLQPLVIDALPADALYTLEVQQPLADTIGRFTTTTPVRYPPETGSESQDQPVNTPVTFGGNLTFLGYVTDESIEYRPGDTLTLVTYWRVDGRVPRDLRLFVHVLADPGARPPANRDIINLSPRNLQNRDVFVQVTRVPLPESLPPGEYQISTGAYQETSDQRLDVLQDGEPRGTRLFLYPIQIVE
ncbi:MAG: ArnT family glycosyltransferase [Phototrophicaceae bacterium]